MRCIQCKDEIMRTDRITNYHYIESGLPNVVLRNIKVRTCPNCGDRLITIPKMPELHKLLANLLIMKEERLASPEIRFLRKYLGWSQRDFASKFHTSVSRVSKWESETNPQNMDSRNEILLRMSVAMGQKINNYFEHMDEVATKEKGYTATQLTLAHTRGEWQEAA